MNCAECGADDAAIVRIKFTKFGKVEYCDKCGDVQAKHGAQPDVYLGSNGGGLQTDMNLHDSKTNKPIPFSSKREKAAIMKRLNLRYADNAERRHGARDVAKNAKYHKE